VNGAGLEASAGGSGLEASAGSGQSSTFGVQSILTTLKVGQTLSVTVAGGKGELAISEIPNSAFVSLDAWIPLGETGTGEITMTGRSVGNTKAVITDRAIPPHQTIINIKVIKDEMGNPATTGGANSTTSPAKASSPPNNGAGLEASAGITWGGKPIIGGDSTIDKAVCDKSAWGINAQGEHIEKPACFVGKVSLGDHRQPNHRMFSPTEAQTIKVAATIIVAPEHVGQAADILLVGVRTRLTDEDRYTRDGEKWKRWNDRVSDLPVAHYYYQLPAIIEVPIYEGDLSFAPGEYTAFVGYRLKNGTIVYNGADPIHFYLGNAVSIDSSKASSYQGEVEGGSTATYFEPFTHNGRTDAAAKVGNSLSFANAEAIIASTFMRVDMKDVGQPADILIAATYFPVPAGSDTISYNRAGILWQQWFGDLKTLQPAQHYYQLPATLEIPIYLGSLASMPGHFDVWVGYRLSSGMIVYNGLDPVRLTVANAVSTNGGKRFQATSRFISQHYHDATLSNPFSNSPPKSGGVTTTLLVAPQDVGQPADILMVIIRNNSAEEQVATAWGDWDEPQVSVKATIAQVILEPIMTNLPSFEGLLDAAGKEDYTVYLGYRLLTNGVVVYNGGERIRGR
jgi:hypothetical protein